MLRPWTIALVSAISMSTSAAAFTIDFEQSSGFGQPGDPLPGTYLTPFGNVTFRNGVLLENPLSPGTQMAAQIPGPVLVSGASAFSFSVQDENRALRVTLVNPQDDTIFVQYLEIIFGEQENDYGSSVPAQGTRVLVLPEGAQDDFAASGLGARFTAASFDYENRCWDTHEVSSCTTNWGIDSIEIVPIPEAGSAGLLLFGLVLARMTRSAGPRSPRAASARLMPR